MRYRLILAAALLGTAGPALAQAPTGEWLVADGGARIRIVDCGDTLWGVVSWEKKPGRDVNNPNAALKSRPTLGMPVLLHMKPAQSGKWEGEVYNSENGQTYDASIVLRGADTLHIEGCALGILCGGEDWTRVTPETNAKASRRKGKPGGKPDVATAPDDQVCSTLPVDPRRSHEHRLEQHGGSQRADERQRQQLAHARRAGVVGEP